MRILITTQTTAADAGSSAQAVGIVAMELARRWEQSTIVAIAAILAKRTIRTVATTPVQILRQMKTTAGAATKLARRTIRTVATTRVQTLRQINTTAGAVAKLVQAASNAAIQSVSIYLLIRRTAEAAVAHAT